VRVWESLGTSYPIDPWKEFDSSEYVDIANHPQEIQDRIYEGARKRLRGFGERSVIIRGTSAEGVGQFATGKLDFVYIDADHRYEAVVEDIRMWYPKVKAGGILAGHDYLDGRLSTGLYGIMSAVNEFATREDLQIYTAGTMESPSWMLQKPPNGSGTQSIPRIQDRLAAIRSKQKSELIRRRVRTAFTNPGKAVRFCIEAVAWRMNGGR
jgi:hypothetical protein